MTGGRRGLRRVVRAAAAVHDRLRPPPAGIVILIYHRVGGGSGTRVDLAPEVFADQMTWLAERARVVPLHRAAELLGSGTDDGGTPVVAVTFDDGTADFVDHALPVLEHHGIPVTYYLATEFIEQARPFPDNGVPLSWGAASEAVSTGLVELGSHTHTHSLLDRATASAAADELDRSVGLIGERVGVAVRHFAYPKAVPASPAAEVEVRRRFDTAALAGTRPNRYGATDLHRLRRSPVQTIDGADAFVAKVGGGGRLEDDLRSVLNRWRYREAVS